MTLGGLALAVGILVDDATVEIENTHRNLAMGKPLVRAVLDGASQIAVPTFVSTLSICIVFVPVLLLTGTAQYLFTPLAMAVVFAMMASYLLSRTLVPTMVHHLLRSEVAVYQAGGHGGRGHSLEPPPRGERAVRAPSLSLHGPARPVARAAGARADRVPGGVARLAACWCGWSGATSSPTWTPGTLRLHARMPPARASRRPRLRFADVEQEIRDTLPAGELDTILDNIGIPNAWSSLAQGDVPNIAATDGEILISLNRERHGPVREYEVQLRKRLTREVPGHGVLLRAGEHHESDSELRPAGADRLAGGRQPMPPANYAIAQRLRERVAAHSGRGRRAHPPGVRAAAVESERRSREGRADGPDAARRDEQHADFAQRQQPGGAELLAESGERRQLQRRRADVAVPHRLARPAAADAGDGGRRARSPRRPPGRSRARRAPGTRRSGRRRAARRRRTATPAR